MDKKIIRSTCLFCSAGCAIRIHMEDGVPVKISGDPDSPAYKGALCMVGKSAIEQFNNPHRLKYPLKRMGERGEGKWQRISWDEALDTTAHKLNGLKEKYGAQSVAFMRGGTKGYSDSLLLRFANAFGSPNTSMAAPVCFLPTLRAHFATYGFFSSPDFDNPPACILMWGVNANATCLPDSLRPLKAMQTGTQLIVIDPAETLFAKKADLWVRPRPGSDLALALAMINVIINEGLYDQQFVEQWTTGFNRLKEHVQDYSPEKMQEVTWVAADTIRQVARLYATTAPACLVSGNGIEHSINNFQTARATCILRALTGNLGKPGGDISWSDAPIIPSSSRELWLQELLSDEQRDGSISASQKMLPGNPYQLHQDITRSVLEGSPYKLRGMFLMGANPVLTYANSKEAYDTFRQFDFLVVNELYMTPSAQLADIVLPVASHLEHDRIHLSEYYPTVQAIQKVAQLGECRSDAHIFNNLAQRMGFGEHFWSSDQQFLDHLLSPSGLTFNEFKEQGPISCKKLFDTHLENGFDTPSKKIELFSSQLEAWGFDPLPIFKEPPESPYSEPELCQQYPLIMTSAKVAPYKHSCGRQVDSLRTKHPDPLATIHRDTAQKYGISEGDWIYIENKRGKITHKAKLSDRIDPRIVVLEHGWWFPENDALQDYWSKSNVNVLTYNHQPYAAEMGSTTLRGLLCKIYKV